jgi:predicted dehydrogenase
VQALKIGLVGAGEIGRYLGLISHETDGVEVVAVVATRQERARAVAYQFGAAAFTDHQQMLSTAPLDAVIVATPSDTHFQIAQDAVSAGVHVFCEKPLAHTVSDCDELIAAADRVGVKLTVGHVLRAMPLFARIGEILGEGSLGKMLAVSLVRIEKPELWGWYKERMRVRSILHEVGAHELDLLRVFAGDVETIQAWAAPRSRSDIDYYDTVQVRLGFLSGALGALTLSWNSPLAAAQGHIICEHGTLHYDWRQGNLLEYVESGGERVVTHVEETEENNGYRRELHSFFAWVRADGPPLVTARDARAAVELAEAACLSLECEEQIRLPIPG